MNALATILSAIAEIAKQWKNFVISAWRKKGQKVSDEIDSSKTDEERAKAARDLVDHMRDKP